MVSSYVVLFLVLGFLRELAHYLVYSTVINKYNKSFILLISKDIS